MALIRCPECDKEISNTVDYCIHCGYKFNNKVIEENKDSQNISIHSSNKKRNILFIIIVIIIIICFLLQVIFYFGMNSSKKSVTYKVDDLFTKNNEDSYEVWYNFDTTMLGEVYSEYRFFDNYTCTYELGFSGYEDSTEPINCIYEVDGNVLKIHMNGGEGITQTFTYEKPFNDKLELTVESDEDGTTVWTTREFFLETRSNNQ